MYLPKLFLVALYLYTGTANAGIIEARRTCSAFKVISCQDSNGKCLGTIYCDYYIFVQKCYCDGGGTVHCGEGCT